MTEDDASGNYRRAVILQESEEPEIGQGHTNSIFLIQATGSAGRRGTEDIDSNKRIGLEDPK